MTDEKKAEKYSETVETQYFSEVTNLCYFELWQIEQAYLDGLAEGRKEKCLEQNNDGTILPCEVMKNNAELKEQLEELKLKNETLNELFDDFQSFFDKLRCCENCKKHRNRECSEDMKFYARTQRKCDKWECVEWQTTNVKSV